MTGWETIRFRLAAMPLRFSPLGAEVNAFARWFEDGASGDRLEAVQIMVDDDGATIRGDDGCIPAGRWNRLWSFLIGLGIRELELDPRLESNQVADVLALLYAEQRTLQDRSPQQETRPATLLRSADGLAHACTVTRLDAGRLTVSHEGDEAPWPGGISRFGERLVLRSAHTARPRRLCLTAISACPVER